MRITKQPDSPLNESQYSDFQQQAPLFEASPSISYKSSCYYHHDQVITNFCRSSGCLLPLCPECVKLHAISHRTQGTHGEFDTIENTVNECFQEIEGSQVFFREDECNFKDFLKLSSEYQTLMQQKLYNSKVRMIEIIESYFNKLGSDLEKRVDLQVKRSQAEIYANLEKLRGKQDQIKEFMGALKSPKVLKTTIQLLSSTFCAEQVALHKEFQSLFKLLHSQKIDVISDENILHTVNCNLVKYISIHNSDLYKYEDSRQPPPVLQKVLTATNQQIIRSQSPPQNLVMAPMKNTIIASNMHLQPQSQPLTQSKNFQPPIVNMSQYLNPGVLMSVQKTAPQGKPMEFNKNTISASKIHKFHPSIPGDPIILDLNKGEIPIKDKKEIREMKPMGGFMPVRINANYMVSQSPPPMRVRSVSPPQQMVKMIYNGNNSNSKMNAVYLESAERGGFIEQGLRQTSKKKQ